MLPSFLSGNPLYVALAGLALVAIGLMAGLLFRRRPRPSDSTRSESSATVWIAVFGAAVSTVVSADTSWRFAATHLGMDSTVERSALFAAGEIGLVSCALLARKNLHSEKRAPGVPGVLIWAITGVQIIPAYTESGLLGGTVRAAFGPVLAGLLWHEAMGVELRSRKADAKSRSLPARIARDIGARLLSRLGIAERDRDAEQISRDRAITRAVTLAGRLAAQTDEQRQGWLSQRRMRRLSLAVDRAHAGTDPHQRQQLLARLAARRHVDDLLTAELKSPWVHGLVDPPTSTTSGAGYRPSGADGPREPQLEEQLDGIKPPPPSSGGTASADNSASGTGPRPHDQAHPAGDRVPAALPLAEGQGPTQNSTSLDALPVQEAPTPKRTGRPPDMTLEEVLDVGRTILERTGSVTHKAFRAELKKLDRKAANDVVAQARHILDPERAGTQNSNGTSE
ncbi:hypothetical protein P8605_00795 [Streptomyces sp. T-3]|nr:hypothetical protein [Streptomyces sp. T-3]